MTHPRKSPRTTGMVALAAFGLVSLGSIAAVGAHPGHATPKPRPAPGHHDDSSWGRPDYDLDDDGILEHVEIDYRHYDRDRDGRLDPNERTSYWMHMFDMGKFGNDLSYADKQRLARIANFFDRDGDGRLTNHERIAISRLIRARKLFVELDRNRDNNVTRREAGVIIYRGGYGNDHYRDGGYYGNDGGFGFFGWYGNGGGYGYGYERPSSVPSRNWIVSRFTTLDRNRNGRVSWNEVETSLIVAYRRGTRL